MKRITLGLLLLLAVGAVWGGACARESGSHTVNLSVLARTLYGAGSGGVVKISQGDTVALRVNADEPMEVFLHGYDVEARVRPGEASTLQFTANLLGHYPLMIHSLGDEGSGRRVEILLGYVDVLPRK